MTAYLPTPSPQKRNTRLLDKVGGIDMTSFSAIINPLLINPLRNRSRINDCLKIAEERTQAGTHIFGQAAGNFFHRG